MTGGICHGIFINFPLVTLHLLSIILYDIGVTCLFVVEIIQLRINN